MALLPGSAGVKDAAGGSVIDLSQELTSARRNLVIPAYLDTLAQARKNDPSGYAAIRSTRQKLLESELSAGPNPFRTQIEVRYRLTAPGTIRLTDLQGRLLAAYAVDTHSDTLILQPDLPSGVYLLQLVQENEAPVVIRVVKE